MQRRDSRVNATLPANLCELIRSYCHGASGCVTVFACRGWREEHLKLKIKEYFLLLFSFCARQNKAHDMHRSIRMRSGWIKGSLLVISVALALLYLGSIKQEVHTHSERLQRAHHNDSIRGLGMLKRMDQMEADINRLRESKSDSWFCLFF